jgi:hypothetical protein
MVGSVYVANGRCAPPMVRFNDRNWPSNQSPKNGRERPATPYRDGNPHARLRAQVVPSGRGAQKKKGQGGEGAQASTPRHVAMTWAQRLKRVFLIDVSKKRAPQRSGAEGTRSIHPAIRSDALLELRGMGFKLTIPRVSHPPTSGRSTRPSR